MRTHFILFLLTLCIPLLPSCTVSEQVKHNTEYINQPIIVQHDADISPELQKYLSNSDCKSEMLELILTLDNSVSTEDYNSILNANNIADQIYNQRKKKYTNVDAIIGIGAKITDDALQRYMNGNKPLKIKYDGCKIEDLIKIPIIKSVSTPPDDTITTAILQNDPSGMVNVDEFGNCVINGVPMACPNTERSSESEPMNQHIVQIALPLDNYLFDPICESKMIEIIIAIDDSLTSEESKSPNNDSGFEAYNDREHIIKQTLRKKNEIINSIIKAGIKIDQEDLETYRTSSMPLRTRYDRCKLKDLMKIPGLDGIEIYYPPHSS